MLILDHCEMMADTMNLRLLESVVQVVLPFVSTTLSPEVAASRVQQPVRNVPKEELEKDKHKNQHKILSSQIGKEPCSRIQNVDEAP